MAPSTPGTGGMSSKVLTMKFMQRAALNTPSPSSDTKRRKTEAANDIEAQNLATAEAVKAAVKEMEEKQNAALERHVATTSDTHWVLPTAAQPTMPKKPLLNVVYVGYGVVDHDDSDADENFDDVKVARTKTADYKPETNIKQGDSNSDGSDSDSDLDLNSIKKFKKIKSISGRGVFDAPPRPAGSPAPRNGISSGSGALKCGYNNDLRSRELRGKRLKKEVKGSQLNRVTKNPFGHRAPGGVGLECHNCGQKGHKRADCSKGRVGRR